MKILSAVILFASLFIASVMLMAISLLCNIAEPMPDIRIEDLMVGNLVPMLTGPTLWGQYPFFTCTFASLVDFYSLLVVGSLFVAVVYLLRVRLRLSYGVTSIAVLTIGVVPYAQGCIALHFGTANPSVCGAWLAVMLIGGLYASIASALVATMGLVPWHRWILARLKRCGDHTNASCRNRSQNLGPPA